MISGPALSLNDRDNTHAPMASRTFSGVTFSWHVYDWIPHRNFYTDAYWSPIAEKWIEPPLLTRFRIYFQSCDEETQLRLRHFYVVEHKYVPKSINDPVKSYLGYFDETPKYVLASGELKYMIVVDCNEPLCTLCKYQAGGYSFTNEGHPWTCKVMKKAYLDMHLRNRNTTPGYSYTDWYFHCDQCFCGKLQDHYANLCESCAIIRSSIYATPATVHRALRLEHIQMVDPTAQLHDRSQNWSQSRFFRKEALKRKRATHSVSSTPLASHSGHEDAGAAWDNYTNWICLSSASRYSQYCQINVRGSFIKDKRVLNRSQILWMHCTSIAVWESREMYEYIKWFGRLSLDALREHCCMGRRCSNISNKYRYRNNWLRAKIKNMSYPVQQAWALTETLDTHDGAQLMSLTVRPF